MSRESLAVTRAVLGLAQGAALYLLYDAASAKVWPATDGLVFAPLVLTAVFIPALAAIGLGNLRLRTFAIWTGAAVVIVAALGAYDAFHDPTGGLFDMGAGRGESPLLWLAVAAGLFIAHTLVVSGDADRAWIAKYPRYFDVAWKHVQQVVLAGAFVAALWALLVLGAYLFDLIGIGFFWETLEKPWFWIPVNALAVALAIHVTDVEATLVRGARTLALTLLSWLLPLFALSTIGFLTTLLFTGLGPLGGAKHTTTIVLAAAAALIVLINAAYQDGVRERRAPLVLRCAGTIAAVALTPLVAIAAYAMLLRVNDDGWTPERVMVIAGVVVAACYAVGYGSAALTRRSWLQRIEMTNVAAAVVILAVIVSLFSPVADPARIAVADKVARLEAGRIPVDQFDFHFLRFHGGRYGMAALERLRQKQDGPDAARIAERANAVLIPKKRADEAPTPPERADEPLAPAERAANIVVAYPKGQSLPPAFLQQDWGPPDRWPSHSDCTTAHATCKAMILDLDGDGTPEIVLWAPNRNVFFVYKKADGKWKLLGYLVGPDCSRAWDELLAGNFEMVAPEFRELKAGGARLQVLRVCP